MEKGSIIYVAGHTGMVGSAIRKNLLQKGYTKLIGRKHNELDLTEQQAVEKFFASEKPEYVFLAAAHVGGIVANNTYRGQFIYDNLMIQNNVVHIAWKHGVKKLLFLGSTCIYPRDVPQPMREDSLLTAPLEYTNEPYAIAKIAGIKLCESYNIQYGTNFISVMPTNLYGPGDNFDLERSHVLPALLRKIHLGKCLENEDWSGIRSDLDKNPIENTDGAASEETILKKLAKYGVNLAGTPSGKPEVVVGIWGTGTPKREFLWSEEMADACVYIMEGVDFKDLAGDRLVPGKPVRNCHINLGTGKEISIRDLAYMIKDTVGFEGGLELEPEKPDGTLRKLTDVSKLHALGWRHHIDIREGILKLYDWYCS